MGSRAGAGVLRRVWQHLRRPGLNRGATAAFLVNGSKLGLAFLAHLAAARALGADGYGIYAYVFAWIALLALAATQGLPTAVLRFASAYVAREEWGLAKSVNRYAERRVILGGATIMLAGWAIVAAFHDSLGGPLARTLAIALPAVPLMATRAVSSSLLRALGWIVPATLPGEPLRYAAMLAGIGLLVLTLAGPLTPEHLAALTVVGVVLSLVVTRVWLARLQPSALRAGTPTAVAGTDEWRRAALPLLLIAGMQLLLGRTDVLMLGWLADTTSVGVYAAAARMAALTSFVLHAVNIVVAPALAAAHGRGEHRQIQAMATWSARAAVVAAGLAALPMALFAASLLNLFGPAFAPGASVLQVLLIGQVVNAATGSVGILMTMSGHERSVATLMAIAVALNISLNGVLIPAFGMLGAALATSSVVALHNLALAFMAWRKLRVVCGPIGASSRHAAA